MSGSIAPSSTNGRSPTRGSYDDVRPLSKGEKGKEAEKEEEGTVALQNEPLPLIHQVPIEVLANILNLVTGPDQPGAAENLYTIQRVCHLWKRLSDIVLERHWNDHRNNPAAALYPFTNAIEERIRGFGSSENLNFSYFFRFQELTRDFGRMGVSIPKEDPETAIQPVLGLQPLQYVEAQKLLDASLEQIWPSIRDQIDFRWRLEPTDIAAIRQWLNDPENADDLARITNLPLPLRGLQLKMLPPEIGKLTRLQKLDLSYNQLATLPPEIAKLTQLQKLDLSHNQLATLPPEIAKLTRLQMLDLSYNQLATLPPEIAKLTRLQEINLFNNQLTTLPPGIGRLAQLQKLNLSHNQLTTLPPEIGSLARLERLYLGGNPLMFIFNKDLSKTEIYSGLRSFIDKHSDCSSYFCQSSLADLCQALHRGVDDETLQENFKALSPHMQQMIRGKWTTIPSPSSSSFQFQAEGDLFDNRVFFAKAVVIAVRAKFDKLSQKEKILVYRRVSELAGRLEKDLIGWLNEYVSEFAEQPSEGSIWGEEHAADNIIRLIDAMELVTKGQLVTK